MTSIATAEQALAPSARADLLAAPLLGEAAILGRAGGENFPVALRGLPAQIREGLLGLYGFARLVDQVGDAASGDRLALLDAVEDELDLAFEGRADHPLLKRLQPVVQRHALPRGPFVRLIDANRWDQRLEAIESWDELRAYCRLSANPVGELVLHLFGQADAKKLERSDAVCTALQVVEHCQDVSEDVEAGRCYLPREDLARFQVHRSELCAPAASPALCAVVALQVQRSRDLLVEGDALVAELSGWARLAVAAFAGGGRATCSALEAAGCDSLSRHVRPRRRRIALETLRIWTRALW